MVYKKRGTSQGQRAPTQPINRPQSHRVKKDDQTPSPQNKSQLKDNQIKINIKYVNIQGLTKAKSAEIEKLIESDKDIICLSETQQKFDKIEVDNTLSTISEMRDLKDKKGGGLMMIFKNNSHIELKKEVSRNKDIYIDSKRKNLCKRCSYNCSIFLSYKQTRR